MDLEDNYKYSLNNEINTSRRRTDSVRSSLLQLPALGSQLDWETVAQRRADLLQEYSHEVDKEDDTNSFITSAMVFAKESSRPNMQDTWSSIYRKRLQEGMPPSEIVTLLNPNLAPIIELSKKFKNTYKNRVIHVKPKTASEGPPTNYKSLTQKPITSNENSNPGRIAKFIGNQIASTTVSPSKSLLLSNKGSPTRVSGIFKKKSAFQPPRTLFSNSQQVNYEPVGYHDRPELIELEEPQVDKTKEIRKASFVTGLEKHLTDEVINNRLGCDQARQIIDDVRKNTVPFKNPIRKLTNNSNEKSAECDKENDNPLLNDERLKGIEKSMIEMIQSEIISNLEGTDWSHIAGLDFAKSKIQQIAILPLKRPDLFTGIRAPPKGIMLFGPPGTGKTMIGRCIASQAQATFFSITSSTLTSKWIGDGEKAMKTLFAVARCLKPSVIFIDEVDSLLKSRSDSEHESSRRMKTEFLSQFDGLSTQSNDGLLVIGTTNRPQELDEAVRRRFAARLYITLPEKCARKHMIVHNLQNEKHAMTEEEIDLIAEKTEGYSGSDMKHLSSEAAMYSFKEVMEKLVELDKDDIRAICYNDFLLALNTIKPSFSGEDLKEYDQWNKKYGSDY